MPHVQDLVHDETIEFWMCLKRYHSPRDVHALIRAEWAGTEILGTWWQLKHDIPVHLVKGEGLDTAKELGASGREIYLADGDLPAINTDVHAAAESAGNDLVAEADADQGYGRGFIHSLYIVDQPEDPFMILI